MLRTIIQLLLCAQLALPAMAFAQDTAKGPADVTVKQYAFMLSVALLGGFVGWYAKVRSGEVMPWNMTQLIGELSTSAFAGLMCFWLCEWMHAPQMLEAALIGIAGHMGTRGVQIFESFLQKRFQVAAEQVSSFFQPMDKK